MRVKRKAEVGETFPEGISLSAVLGFKPSISLSRYLLNAMAAVRAKTMERRTKAPNSKPLEASGSSIRPK